jgi:EAL domain-containing protein (putative c-di-GMP-specific phosphodiesterase class I)
MPRGVSLAPSRPSDALSADLDRTRRTRAQVETLIAEPALLGPDFTPIRRLDAAAPGLAPLLGWKATGRGGPGSDIADTLTLLEQAAALGLVERLDWAFRAHTFDIAVDAAISGELHLTPEPETFGSPCPPRLAVSVLRGRRALSVCAELHADAFSDERRLLPAAEEMQSWGWQLVYADLLGSSAHAAAVRLAPLLRPAYVQIDLSVAGRASDPGVAGWARLAEEVGAQVMALGVDNSPAVETAVRLGATYGRGSVVGRPVSTPR